MIYGIPSYKRPECKTVRALQNSGVDRKDIVISTQTEEDYALYSRRHREIEVIYEPQTTLSGNRNTLIKHSKGERIVLIDDDINYFGLFEQIGKERYKRTKILDLPKVVSEMFKIAQENHCAMYGISATDNALVRSKKYDTDINMIFPGTFIGLLETAVFDTDYQMCQDYELICRLIKNGKNVIRFNNVFVAKPQDGTFAGGQYDLYKQGKKAVYIDRLEKQYAFFKGNKKRTGGHIVWR